MATIPRTYMTTSKSGLSSVPLINGQVISVWDNDEVWYDVPANGQKDGQPVRRKISGIRVVDTLPDNPMTDIVYVYIGDHGTIPETGDPLYDLRVWVNDAWLVVGNNLEDVLVKTTIADVGDKFYLSGTTDASDGAITSLYKDPNVFVLNGEINQVNGLIRGKSTFSGTADYATEAGTADKAEHDLSNQAITSYIRGLSSDATTNLGSTITITKGDGTSSTIRVSDTTYDVFTVSGTDGLVPGTSTVIQQDTSNLILTGDGWIATTNFILPAADSADKDGLGQVIANTYLAGLSYDTSTDILTYTLGSGSTGTVSIPNTEYGVFDVNDNGLVPKPLAAETGYFLRGDGTWQSVVQASDIFVGGDSGNVGLVPASTDAELGGFLKGDATWGSVFDTADDGLVPAASTAGDTNKFLKGDSTWATPIDTQNTAGSEADTSHKLYLIGAQTQSNAGEGVATYSNANVYIQSSKLFSGGAEVVDVSSSQALTNKTSYNGFVLASACSRAAADTITATTDVPTNSAVINYVAATVPGLISTAVTNKCDKEMIASEYDSTQSYSVNDWCVYTDANGDQLYRCISATTGTFDDQAWQSYTVIEAIKYLIAHPS